MDPEKSDSESPTPTPGHKSHKVLYYDTIRKYLKAVSTVEGTREDLKEESSEYELRDGILYHSDLGTPVQVDLGSHRTSQGGKLLQCQCLQLLQRVFRLT